ncbi:adenylate/guanylate cyclase domain-containing protein [Ignavibacterium sp.]|uniref:adenylate/guanylate cyclase domain-containing protein n=1 Tax=Ignavibacterium sp. TaxID=2651167 RepID=UPI00220945D3|nr:adenylate/guanylate cyclase domain-containing protein [Ignavibacterium sp.]BDQ03170.1 MAG: guanylate cyclase [Ignavibacterium sp.]
MASYKDFLLNRLLDHLGIDKKIPDEKLIQELVSSEKLRAKILAFVLTVMLIVIIIIGLVYSEEFKPTYSSTFVFLITAGMILFLLLRTIILNKVVKHWTKFGFGWFNFFRYVNIFLEISIPTIVLYFYSFFIPSVYPLLTPISSIYFIIIFLSALELDAHLSIFSGLIAAIEFTILSLILLDNSTTKNISPVLQFFPMYLGKALLFALSGFIAAMVTNQVKKILLRYFETREERNKIEHIFGQMVSKEIVEDILNNQTEIVSRTRFACIMFLDIRNFSLFAENKSPEEIIEYQNKVFAPLIEIVNKHKGIVTQIMGDGFMAIFGAPIEHENDCQLALNAAIEIHKVIREKNENGDIPITKIGIGLNAGEVVTGNVGAENRKQYSITGRAVIVAARLEQLNKEFNSELLISRAVFERINLDGLKPVRHFQVKIKGQSEPIEVYQII